MLTNFTNADGKSCSLLLRHIIDASAEAVLLIDPEQQVIAEVNQVACQLLGYSREELLGQSVSMIECSLLDIFFWEELRSEAVFHDVRQIESEWLSKHGQAIAVGKRVSCFDDGDLRFWLLYAQDLSRSRTIEHEQVLLTAQLQTSLEATAEGIMVSDLDGHLENFNRKFADIWEIPDEILMLRQTAEVFEYLQSCLLDPTVLQQTLQAVSENREIETEDVLELHHQRFIVCVSKPQIHRDRLTGRVFSFRDISAMKLAESNLVLARDAAEEASRVKSQFLSQMSHELRTPLNAIIGFAQLLEIEASGTALDHLSTITRAGKHLLNIINEILDVSKIEAGRMEVELLHFSPLQIIDDVAQLIASQIEQKDLHFAIQFDYPIPAKILSDPTKFRQIILNLLTNALKFTAQGSIQLHLSCQFQQLCIRVIDTGTGISEEQQKKLFNAFAQADSSTTRKFGGTGLGLYISFQLAQLLGGTITLESTLGVGSCFSLTLATGNLDGVAFIQNADDVERVRISANQQEQVNAPAQKNLQRLSGHVLLAEDGLDNQRLFCAYMRKAGITVTAVENGSLALEHAMCEEFDLILMDMQMPVMGGLEATTILRQAAYMKPIVALTANVLKEDIEAYTEAGCTDYMSKPIDREKFFLMLSKYLPAESADANAENLSMEQDIPIEEMDFYRELSAQFVAGLPETLMEIENAYVTQNWQELGSVVHILKGTAGNFGHPQLSHSAQELIHVIRGDEPGLIPSHTEQLISLLKAVIAA